MSTGRATRGLKNLPKIFICIARENIPFACRILNANQVDEIKIHDTWQKMFSVAAWKHGTRIRRIYWRSLPHAFSIVLHAPLFRKHFHQSVWLAHVEVLNNRTHAR